MYKLYFIALIGALVVGAYVWGGQVANEKCRGRYLARAWEIQSETQKIQEKVNAESFNRGVDDIRRFLHEKYTIAE